MGTVGYRDSGLQGHWAIGIIGWGTVSYGDSGLQGQWAGGAEADQLQGW